MSERAVTTDLRERIAKELSLHRADVERDIVLRQNTPWSEWEARRANRILAIVREGEEPAGEIVEQWIRAEAPEETDSWFHYAFYPAYVSPFMEAPKVPDAIRNHPDFRVTTVYAAPAPRGASGE